MNAEKLARMQNAVRTGGKGSVRRKKKAVHKSAAGDDKKLQTTLKRLNVNPIPGIDEVQMIKGDGTVLHFSNPKVQASIQANTYAITGTAETKQLSDMLPEGFQDMMQQMQNAKANAAKADAGGDDDVPELVEGANFEEASKK